MSTRHIAVFVAAAVAALASLDRGVRAEAPRYTVEFLGSTIYVTELNNDGWAIGWTISGVVVSWAATPTGGYQMLQPLSGATDTRAHDINESGVIVGESGGQPVRWDHADGVYGAPTVLPIVAGNTGGRATAVNDVGDIVGLSTQGQFTRTTLFTGPGAPVDLGALGFWPTPAAMNDARQVVGHDRMLDLDTGVVTQFPAPAGPPSFLWTVAGDINESGQVCSQGVLATSQPDDRLPVRWTPGVGWEQLMTLPTPYGTATSINDLGDCGLGYVKAVSIEGEGLLTPDALLAPSETGWTFGGPFAIEHVVIVNDRRQILTTGTNAGLGVSGAVLLTPTNLSGDIDGLGAVNVDDLLIVLARWGTADPAADCTMDGVVAVNDLLHVLATWGP